VLNLISKGKWITAYIELPNGYKVSEINISSIRLNETIPAEPCPIKVSDYDNDAVPDLMVKFDRQQVIKYIIANVDSSRLMKEGFMIVTLTATGKLNDGTQFRGSDTIKIILPMPRKHAKYFNLTLFLSSIRIKYETQCTAIES